MKRSPHGGSWATREQLYKALGDYAVVCAGEQDSRGADRALREAFALERPEWPPRLRLFGAACAAAASGYAGQVGIYRKRCLSALALAQAAGAEGSALSLRLLLADAALTAGDFNGAIASGWAIVAETSASGHATSLCDALTTLCAALARKGDLPAARSAARQALPMVLRDGRPGPLFDHIALLASVTGHADTAAKLLGCADAWNAAIRRTRWPSEARSAELAERRIEPALGAGECRRLRAEGAKLSAAQGSALAEALLEASSSDDANE